MSAILRAGLAVGGYRARIVIRHHHDESGAEDHQEGEQIARPLGFHYLPADRHNFGFQAGRGRRHKFVRHRSISLSACGQKHHKHNDWQPNFTAARRDGSFCWRCRRRRTGRPVARTLAFGPSRSPPLKLVEAAAASAIANAYRITAGTPTPNASKYSEADRRSVTYTFLEASRSSGGKQKAISPGAEEMANYRR